MLPLAVPLALGAVNIIGKGIKAYSQNRKARRIERNNPRPEYEISPEFYQNAEMANNMARVGLPSQQYNNALNNIGRNTVAGLRQAGRFGGNNIASILRSANDATMGLDAQDAAARQANQRFAFGQRSILGNQRLNKWQWDKQAKYGENVARAQALRGAASANLDSLLSDASNLAAASMMGGSGESTAGIGGGSAPIFQGTGAGLVGRLFGGQGAGSVLRTPFRRRGNNPYMPQAGLIGVSMNNNLSGSI